MKPKLPLSLRAALLLAVAAAGVPVAHASVEAEKINESLAITGKLTNYPSTESNQYKISGDLTLGEGDMVGIKDANGKLLESFAQITVHNGNSVSFNSNLPTVMTKNLNVSGTLTLESNAQLSLGGQYKNTAGISGFATTTTNDEYTGVIADEVNVKNTAFLNSYNATVNKLSVSGGTVNIHANGNAGSGNEYFRYEENVAGSKQVQIKHALTITGGSTTIGKATSSNYEDKSDAHICTTFGELRLVNPESFLGQIYDAENVDIKPSLISQEGGTLKVQGKSASIGGLNIDQSGGSMSISTDGTNHSWHILSDYGDSTIEQSGDVSTTLEIGGIIAENSKYNLIVAKLEEKGVTYKQVDGVFVKDDRVLDINPSVAISQSGKGTITIHQGIDLNNYRVNSNGVASLERSSISQSGSGIINLNGNYVGGHYAIEQSGIDGAINLKGTMTVADGIRKNADDTTTAMIALALTDTATFNVAGALTVASGSTMNFTVNAVDGDAAMKFSGDGDLTLTSANLTLTLTDAAVQSALTNATMLLDAEDGMTLTTSLAFNLMSGLSASDMSELSDLIANNSITFNLANLTARNAGFPEGVTFAADHLTVNSGTNTLQAVVTMSQTIPEPTTATLSLLALAALAARRRRASR